MHPIRSNRTLQLTTQPPYKPCITSTNPYILAIYIQKDIAFYIILCVFPCVFKSVFFFYVSGSQDSVVGIEATLRAGRSGARIPAGAWGFSLAPNRPDRLWGPPSLLFNVHRGSLHGVKWLGRDVNPSLPSSSEVKNKWRYTSTAPTSLHGVDMNLLCFPSCLCISLFWQSSCIRLQDRVSPLHITWTFIWNERILQKQKKRKLDTLSSKKYWARMEPGSLKLEMFTATPVPIKKKMRKCRCTF